MQELLNKVMTNAGVTEEQAKKSIEAVSGYIKDKLPDSFKGQIDNLINGGKLSEGIKNKLLDVSGDLREKAEEVIQDVKVKADEVAGKLRDIFSDKK